MPKSNSAKQIKDQSSKALKKVYLEEFYSPNPSETEGDFLDIY